MEPQVQISQFSASTQWKCFRASVSLNLSQCTLFFMDDFCQTVWHTLWWSFYDYYTVWLSASHSALLLTQVIDLKSWSLDRYDGPSGKDRHIRVCHWVPATRHQYPPSLLCRATATSSQLSIISRDIIRDRYIDYCTASYIPDVSSRHGLDLNPPFAFASSFPFRSVRLCI